jgi:hypothetical protein
MEFMNSLEQPPPSTTVCRSEKLAIIVSLDKIEAMARLISSIGLKDKDLSAKKVTSSCSSVCLVNTRPDTFSQTCNRSTIHSQPSASKDRAVLEEIFAAADIHLDGRRPWDIRVNDAKVNAFIECGDFTC